MNRFTSEPNTTGRWTSGQSTPAPTRQCFGCNRHKICTGGALDKRTRMWYCAGCKKK